VTDPAPDIRITAGQPSDDDVAAVTAVLTAALDELAGEHRRRGDGAPSAWESSRRAIRNPLPFGAWRNFEA
jgi:hypothetical protein